MALPFFAPLVFLFSIHLPVKMTCKHLTSFSLKSMAHKSVRLNMSYADTAIFSIYSIPGCTCFHTHIDWFLADTSVIVSAVKFTSAVMTVSARLVLIMLLKFTNMLLSNPWQLCYILCSKKQPYFTISFLIYFQFLPFYKMNIDFLIPLSVRSLAEIAYYSGS